VVASDQEIGICASNVCDGFVIQESQTIDRPETDRRGNKCITIELDFMNIHHLEIRVRLKRIRRPKIVIFPNPVCTPIVPAGRFSELPVAFRGKPVAAAHSQSGIRGTLLCQKIILLTITMFCYE
jgi:hypothetical protein